MWIGLPNEAYTLGPANTNYRDLIVTLARRIRGKGFTGPITLPLGYWSMDLQGLAAGDYDTLAGTLNSFNLAPWVWEFHNYGKRFVSGSASMYTYAQMDADLAACQASDRAVWMAEHGEATPIGGSTTGGPNYPGGTPANWGGPLFPRDPFQLVLLYSCAAPKGPSTQRS